MTDEPFDPSYLAPDADPGSDDVTGLPFDDVGSELIPLGSADLEQPAADPAVDRAADHEGPDAAVPPDLDVESPFAGLWGEDDGLQAWLDQTPSAPEPPDPAADLLFTGRLQEIVADDVSGVDRDRLVEDAVRRSLQTDG